jgi:2-desacetyl-2-hydroxyethyl bacteriochlorophyllide A dehydrogenase
VRKAEMKGFVLRGFGEEMALETLPDPAPGPRDIVLRVLSLGLCYTDVKILRGLIPAPYVKLPHTLGHEIAGEIVALGPEVRDLRVGDRGVAYHYVTCGRCELCRTGRENLCRTVRRLGFELPGGLAEFISLPADNFCPFENSLDPGPMAILSDAVATPYHALKELGRVGAGQDVLVVGVGGLGVHGVQLASLMGARVIAADVKPEALDLARRFGAESVIDASSGDSGSQLMEITRGRGVDTVMEVVGSPQTLKWSLPCLKRGGRLLLVGYDPCHPFPLDLLAMHYNEWAIVAARGTTRQELQEVITLVSRGRVRPVISKEVPWTRASEALSEVGRGPILGRIVLRVSTV